MDNIKEIQDLAKNIASKQINHLTHGAIDMHCHGYPEVSLSVRARLDDVKTLELAREYGMRGIVFKSNLWPTTGRVYHLRQRVPDMESFGSITLNPVAGGLTPWVVEAAASQGAKVVWLPTWCSVNRQVGGSVFMKVWFPSLKSISAISCMDQTGQLLPEVKDIIALAKELDLVLCTGHIPPVESLAIAAEAEKVGLAKLVFTHPLWRSTGATLEQTREMVRRGAYIEFCASSLFSGELNETIRFISELGAGHCILSTDSFMEWEPPEPELLRMFLARLLIMGIDEDKIFTMVRDNPARLLGV